MKVLILTYYFPPSGGAGVQRWLKFVKYLPQFDVEPIVLTVDEHDASYPQIDNQLLNEVPSNIRVVKTKTREILSFYKKLSPNKEVPYGGFANESKVGFFQKVSRAIRGNFFLPDPRRGWNKFALKRAIQLIEQEQIDTIITTSPPHSTQLIGLALKKRFPHIRWIADLRDPWTDIYYNKELYQSAFAKKWNARYERQVLEQADKIITVSNSCKENFASKTTCADKLMVIPNGYDEVDFQNVSELSQTTDKKVISYVGVLSSLYDVNPFVEALKKLTDEEKSKLLLRFVGNVDGGVLESIKSVGIEVDFVQYVPHKEAIAYMCGSDVLLLFLPQTKENKGILTGKLFEYLAAKHPILLVAEADGDAAKLIVEQSAGVALNDAGAIADYLRNVSLASKEELQVFSSPEKYSRFSLTEELVKLLKG